MQNIEKLGGPGDDAMHECHWCVYPVQVALASRHPNSCILPESVNNFYFIISVHNFISQTGSGELLNWIPRDHR